MPLELCELRAVREVPDDDSFVAATRREPVAVERGQANYTDIVRVPLELGELRAVREVPDDDGFVVAPRREPAAVERGQAIDIVSCAPSARATAATALYRCRRFHALVCMLGPVPRQPRPGRRALLRRHHHDRSWAAPSPLHPYHNGCPSRATTSAAHSALKMLSSAGLGGASFKPYGLVVRCA